MRDYWTVKVWLTMSTSRVACCSVGRAVLSQVQNGVERVLAYSQTHNRPERQYCATCKELLAVVKGIHHFHVYLYDRPFKIRTDHAALKWLLCFRSPGQTAWWLQRLQEYDFSIEHRTGLKHLNADALLCWPYLQQSYRCYARLEAKENAALLAKENGADT